MLEVCRELSVLSKGFSTFLVRESKKNRRKRQPMCLKASTWEAHWHTHLSQCAFYWVFFIFFFLKFHLHLPLDNEESVSSPKSCGLLELLDNVFIESNFLEPREMVGGGCWFYSVCYTRHVCRCVSPTLAQKPVYNSEYLWIFSVAWWTIDRETVLKSLWIGSTWDDWWRSKWCWAPPFGEDMLAR